MVAVATPNLPRRGQNCDMGDIRRGTLARFEPTDCEDFDEALSRVKQTGTLREYKKEFEKLGNRVQGWTQKVLVGTFMGGLKYEIQEEI